MLDKEAAFNVVKIKFVRLEPCFIWPNIPQTLNSAILASRFGLIKIHSNDQSCLFRDMHSTLRRLIFLLYVWFLVLSFLFLRFVLQIGFVLFSRFFLFQSIYRFVCFLPILGKSGYKIFYAISFLWDIIHIKPVLSAKLKM